MPDDPNPAGGSAAVIDSAGSDAGVRPAAPLFPPASFAALLRRLKAEGCLEKQAGYYTRKILLNLALLALSLALFATVRPPWLQLLNAAFLGFVCVQMGLVVHDLGHHQAYRAGWKNDLAGILLLNLLMGISYRYWLTKHNAHHRDPNRLDRDPDLGFPFALCAAEARRTSGLYRLLVRHQALLFFPFLSMGWASLQYFSVGFLLRRVPRGFLLLETVLTPLHYACYFGLLFALLPPVWAVLFVLVHQAVCGLYLGVAFATNHIGMPVLEGSSRPGYVYLQAATARNIRANPVSDYLLGTLSCQIEHHLVRSIAVNKLRQAQRLIRPFCARHAIPYHETSVWQALREILSHLHQVSRAAT
jgi:fatty acid desaturase